MSAFVYDDGGREAAGYRGKAGDCVARAIAIAAAMPYADAYELVNAQCIADTQRKNGRAAKNSARTGVRTPTLRRIMKELGWTWTPTMHVGSGCKVHLKATELPKGRIVVNLSKHVCAVIDGVVRDTHDCTRNGTRCVYGYWQVNL